MKISPPVKCYATASEPSNTIYTGTKMFQSSLALHFSVSPRVSPLLLQTKLPRRSPLLVRAKASTSVAVHVRDGSRATTTMELLKPNQAILKESSVSDSINRLGRNLGFRSSPKLGFRCFIFVISTAIGAVLSLAIVSIPALSAFKRLSTSMDKLSKVVSEEVPGTLSSLKLSGMEINDLTQQLGNIRQTISGGQQGKKYRRNGSGSKGDSRRSQ